MPLTLPGPREKKLLHLHGGIGRILAARGQAGQQYLTTVHVHLREIESANFYPVYDRGPQVNIGLTAYTRL
jgi:hypothetical protein